MGCECVRKSKKNEGYLTDSIVLTPDQCLLKVSRSICKISTKMQFGTGFLLKHLINEKYYYFLISNEHIISNDMIQEQEEIEVFYDNEFKTIKILLNQKERYINTFKRLYNLDITVVQILSKDGIEDGNFLLAEENINKNKLIGMNIYIPQYPEGGNLKQAKGIIKRIDNNEIVHLVSTNNGSSGSPLFLENSIKVIGIHKQGDTAHTENYADFIYPIFDIIKNGFELIKKPIPQPPVIIHSIIKIYYENGKLMYEGGFIDNKFEGYGKYYYLNGEYYEGQFKNGIRDGNV